MLESALLISTIKSEEKSLTGRSFKFMSNNTLGTEPEKNFELSGVKTK